MTTLKTTLAHLLSRAPVKKRLDIGDRQYLITSDDQYLRGLEGAFEPELVTLCQTLAAGSATALDVGANIGCTTLLLAQLADHVHAFEPSPTTFAYLARNIALSPHRNITPHNLGLGSAAGQSTLTFDPADRSGGFVSDKTTAVDHFTVETITIKRLDDIAPTLGSSTIDFIKIDVEGFEGHVLQGAAETLATHRPVVLLELNHWCLNAFQRTSVPDFFDSLRASFPILLAVDGRRYLDLNDPGDAYTVMYYHILHDRFPNLVAAFEDARLTPFRRSYDPGFDPDL